MKWFKHDADANVDAKLMKVRHKYGAEGYGLYWYCIELIAQRVNGDNLTFELEHDARIIARNTGSTPQKVEQMMTTFINLGLLNADNGHVFCLKLASRCDDFTAKSVRRQGIKTLTNQSVGVSPSLSDKVHLEEEVRSKKIEEEVITEVDKKPPAIAVDFSVMQMSDNELSELKRIRKNANKGKAITQRVVNELAKQFMLAANMGHTFDECLTEWETRSWKSFKAEWMPQPKSNQGMSKLMQQNIQNTDGWGD